MEGSRMISPSPKPRKPLQRTCANCATCGKELDKSASAINRAKRDGKPLYCNKVCFGLSRRTNKTDEQKKEEKRLYDIAYREKNLARIKTGKHEWFQRTYDPVKAAVERKKKMPQHVEYCRQPEYKKKKQVYDAQHRAKKQFGEFYESFLILQQIDQEVASRASKYEIGLENGTINKAQTRRRNYERTYSNQS
jgi:CRISPR/Cas system CSM-associated protein Csm2 small subunit